MKNKGNRLFFFLFFISIQGCVHFPSHSYYPVEITFIYKDSLEPVSQQTVHVEYYYHNYGFFYDLRKPKNIYTKTDDQGKIKISLADYSGGINIIIAENTFHLDKEIVRKEIQISDFPVSNKQTNNTRAISMNIKAKKDGAQQFAPADGATRRR